MAYWHGIVILLFFVALSIVLPDIVNSVIGVALLFLFVGYKLGHK